MGFNLSKEDNVCQYVVRREAGKKKKAPKVQRLTTKQRLQRTRRLKAETLAGIVASREAKKDWTARVAQLTLTARRSVPRRSRRRSRRRRRRRNLTRTRKRGAQRGDQGLEPFFSKK